MSQIIEVNGVSKRFKKRTLMKDVNITVNEGSTIGLVGENGSGKSVLYKMIVGLIEPDTGEVIVRGKRIGRDVDFPSNTGALINDPGYIAPYSGFKNLKYLAEINQIIDDEKIRDTLKRVGLDPEDKTKVKDYSSGMKKKLGIAQAIMENQDIIILDEPFNALDAKSVVNIRQVIKELQTEGKTILLTSHNHEDIEMLCNDVYIILDQEVVEFDEKIKEMYFSHQ
ncbi:ABC transporter ATP-binding protein [Aliicoccus persicus]|uniref:ABC-2 type transport system ATP-binding protein n=1 Tax=Aliicoccus persicus TaxID=930138 RepID=A0A662Z5P5_9STAP|nr:ABC transporter ATP-binding protein [Aliicoccus persicus]SEW01748.1 ABC-2 type transport system ATP-binding protein [Aliicoccus persicus]